MRKYLATAPLLAIVLAAIVLAPVATPAEELLRERAKSDVGIELLGKAAIYSFFYQYTVNRSFAVEAGFGMLGSGTAEDNASVAFFPLGAKLYLIPRDGTFFLTGGVTIVTAGTDSGPFDESATFGYLGPGIEFRSEGGFLFRGTAYGLFAGGSVFIWPGLAVGFAF